MGCVQAREAMSAQMDGEPPGVRAELTDAHVQECHECQAWRDAAFDGTRRVRMTGWTQSTDLTGVILAGVRPARQSRSRLLAGWSGPLPVFLLVAAAAGQLVLTAPLLLGSSGSDMNVDMHGMHELGVFDFALAVAFLVGAIRPRLAGGMAWPCCAAAVGLLATSMVDVIDHHTFETHELRHLIAVAGAALLCWTARTVRRPEPDGIVVNTANNRGAEDLGGSLPVAAPVSTKGAA